MADDTTVTVHRRKASYIGAPAVFSLELACRHIFEAFESYGCYVVGSSLERPDYRDVDVRMIMPDDEFVKLFPDAGDVAHARWEHDPRWLLLTVSISQWLKSVTSLPVDFQFQPQSHANARHPGRRDAVGFKITKEKPHA